MHQPQLSNLRRSLCAALLLAATMTVANAQSYPSRPVRVIVPVSAGTAGDVLTRAMTVKLGESWGQQVIIDNRPGANTLIGAEAVAKSAPDGYTLLFTTEATLVSNPALFAKLPYDPLKDFEPVTMLFSGAMALAVHPATPARTLAEYLALAKAKPGELTYASTGNGSAAHINFELLKQAAGVDIRHIPYKGAGAAITDLLGGQVGALLVPEGLAAQFVKDGKVRILAAGTTSPPLLPGVPSYADAGLPQYTPLMAWGAIAAPAGTPKSVIAKLNADIAAALKHPDVRALYAAQGVAGIGNSEAEFAKVIRTDTQRWSKAVKDSGATLD